jgi:hypothetical protein
MRSVASEFGVVLRTVQRWVRRAAHTRLDRVKWSDRPDGCTTPANRAGTAVEELVLQIRTALKAQSALGEYGAAAIWREMVARVPPPRDQPVPSVRTIGRILLRRGALDGRYRARWPAPPRGWFLPAVAAGTVELDSFDIVEDLVIQHGPFIHVLNGISLHGGLCASWPRTQITAKNTVLALLEHWRAYGLPGYAKFDNDMIFQGAHLPDTFGRVTRLCLSLGVAPVFTPPRETGFQADVENYNGRWQAKVWRRFKFTTPEDVAAQSARFVTAARQRAAPRIENAPPRRPFPADWRLDFQRPLQGMAIFLRRTDEHGTAHVLGHRFPVSAQWVHRLVRAEVHLTVGEMRFYALRRRDPTVQPLLITHRYRPPQRPFHE